MNNKKCMDKLREIAQEPQPSIRREVAQEALNYSYDNLADFFHDLLHHGCISGMVGKLVYYYDTHAFFNNYYREIEDLRFEYEEQGIELKPTGDLMNWYAWFSFEETARKLAEELGIIS